MYIAIVDFTVLPQDREQALEILVQDVPAAREMPGNLSFRTFSNTGENGHIGILHEWESEADFNNYITSEHFARIGAQLRPLASAPPVSRRFQAELQEEVRA